MEPSGSQIIDNLQNFLADTSSRLYALGHPIGQKGRGGQVHGTWPPLPCGSCSRNALDGDFVLLPCGCEIFNSLLQVAFDGLLQSPSVACFEQVQKVLVFLDQNVQTG